MDNELATITIEPNNDVISWLGFDTGCDSHEYGSELQGIASHYPYYDLCMVDSM